MGEVFEKLGDFLISVFLTLFLATAVIALTPLMITVYIVTLVLGWTVAVLKEVTKWF